MNSTDIINLLLREHSEIATYRYLPFIFDNKIQARISDFNVEEKASVELAKDYKKKYSISFWEAYLRSCETENNIQRRLTKGALFHKPNSGYLYIENDGVDSLKKIPKDLCVALNSEVILKNGTKRHIPLLDFKIKYFDRNLPIVQEILYALKLTGAIVNSGKSYHFIGNRLVTSSELTELLAKFILLHPISDKSWSAHQIIEGSASIRITKKDNVFPSLIATIN